MNILKRFFLVIAFAACGYAQINTLVQTSLSSAINGNVQTFNLASATGILATFQTSTMIYVDREAMLVLSVGVPTATSVTVARGQYSTAASGHASGAMVLAGRPDWFSWGGSAALQSGGPIGACTPANVYAAPYVNIGNAAQSLCSSVTGTWVPGWQNGTRPPLPTAAVASAAGLITPSGPLFHVTGTAAVTGFNLPVGFEYGVFTIIPDNAFTTTTANNIALASTAVVGRPMRFTYDSVTAKFYPSY